MIATTNENETTTTTTTTTPPTSQWKPPAKGKFPISFNPKEQKPLKDLALVDVFLWRNVFVSAILFILTHAIYLLLTKYKFTVVTLVGRVIQIQVIIFFLYIVFARIVKNTSGTYVLMFVDMFLIITLYLALTYHSLISK
jgi:hypothetical protein